MNCDPICRTQRFHDRLQAETKEENPYEIINKSYILYETIMAK